MTSVWHMDKAGNRTSGVFTTPSAPSPNPTAWTLVAPRWMSRLRTTWRIAVLTLAGLALGCAAGASPLITATADTTLQSNQSNAHLGTSVAPAGDVNGDGYDDVIVGASDLDAGQVFEGAAFVFLGSAAGIRNSGATSASALLQADLIWVSCACTTAGRRRPAHDPARASISPDSRPKTDTGTHAQGRGAILGPR